METVRFTSMAEGTAEDYALLDHYEVSPAVNRVANDSAELIAPASAVAGIASSTPESAPAKPKQPDDQLSLF